MRRDLYQVRIIDDSVETYLKDFWGGMHRRSEVVRKNLDFCLP